MPREDRFVWVCEEPFNELASHARLTLSAAHEALLALKRDGVVLNGEDECTMVLPPSDLHQKLDEDLGHRMAYAWCFQTPLEPEERAVIATMCWKSTWDSGEVAAASACLGLPESRVGEIVAGLQDRLDQLSAEAGRGVGGVPSATPEARMCRALIELVHHEGIKPRWLDIDAPPGWTRAERVSGAVAYRSTNSNLVAVVFEAAGESGVLWRQMQLFFPAQLTADMLLEAGTVFLGHGSRAKIGRGFLDLEKAAGANCFQIGTTKPLGSLKDGDVTLTKEGIDVWGQWMSGEFDRRRARSAPS